MLYACVRIAFNSAVFVMSYRLAVAVIGVMGNFCYGNSPSYEQLSSVMSFMMIGQNRGYIDWNKEVRLAPYPCQHDTLGPNVNGMK